MANKCVYCVQVLSTEKDHIPGEAFFPPPKPNNLIKVPVCKACHNAIKKDEDYSRQLFLMSPAAESGPGRILWDSKAHRSIQKDRGLRHAILRGVEPVDLVTRSGIYLGMKIGIRVDWDRVHRFIDKCVRGLFYFEFSEPLPRTAIIARRYVDERDELLRTFIDRTSHGKRRWPDVFDYRRMRDKYDKSSSLWAFRFFGGMAFVAYTENSRSKSVV